MAPPEEGGGRSALRGAAVHQVPGRRDDPGHDRCLVRSETETRDGAVHAERATRGSVPADRQCVGRRAGHMGLDRWVG